MCIPFLSPESRSFIWSTPVQCLASIGRPTLSSGSSRSASTIIRTPGYYQVIQSVRQRDLDLTDSLECFTFGLRWQFGEAQEKGETLIRLDVLAQRHELSGRQLVALEMALLQTTFQLQDFAARFPSVHRRSLQFDLRGLVEQGFLEAAGATNSLVYRRRANSELATNSRRWSPVKMGAAKGPRASCHSFSAPWVFAGSFQ